MRRKRGLALITVLLVSLVVLGLVWTGLAFSTNNALHHASVHGRNTARYAAQAGVYRAIMELEKDSDFGGTLSEELPNLEARFEVEVDNRLTDPDPAERLVHLRSVGHFSRYTRALRVTVAPGADSFPAVGSQGPIQSYGINFINAIAGIRTPYAQPGDIHTNSDSPDAIRGSGWLDLTGLASAVGSIQNIVIDPHREENADPISLYQVDKNALLSGSFTASGSVPETVSENLRVAQSIEVPGNLHLASGATLHVQGDLIVHGSITGDGVVVADGSIQARGSPEVDLDNTVGVLLYADEDVELAAPEATKNVDQYVVAADPIVTFFGQMPPLTPIILSENLPVSAPNGIEFFRWYSAQSASPGEEFSRWRDGVGTELEPGLPGDVRDWLDSSRQILPQLEAWANEGGGR
ncbi:MAG: hypothetical protein HY319_19735 [Armatimonadetes bacterium]|nr:hypothetical protein [Armatimonadota bacterium]